MVRATTKKTSPSGDRWATRARATRVLDSAPTYRAVRPLPSLTATARAVWRVKCSVVRACMNACCRSGWPAGRIRSTDGLFTLVTFCSGRTLPVPLTLRLGRPSNLETAWRRSGEGRDDLPLRRLRARRPPLPAAPGRRPPPPGAPGVRGPGLPGPQPRPGGATGRAAGRDLGEPVRERLGPGQPGQGGPPRGRGLAEAAWGGAPAGGGGGGGLGRGAWGGCGGWRGGSGGCLPIFDALE